jgi:hypothetical protein
VQLKELKSHIFNFCPKKQLNGQNLNGRMMISMIESFVETINTNQGVPNI